MSESNPSVSVVIPAKGGAGSLARAISSVRMQTYTNITEVIVAAGDPESAHEAQLLGAKVVMNPQGRTPAALNLAIGASSGDVIVRCDTHSILPPSYVERAVDALLETGADNVGGMQVPVGATRLELAIAHAMASRFGAGDARYRVGGEEGSTETVYLGVFRRSTLERIGGFDEEFIRTQDYEMNHRIIEAGGLVWFLPDLKVEYRPRGSLRALARQYFEYGKAKRQFSRKHPGALRWRQFAPPTLVVVLAGSVLVGAIWTYAFVIPGLYAVALLLAGFASVRPIGHAGVLVPPVLAIMHIAWGVGFLFA